MNTRQKSIPCSNQTTTKTTKTTTKASRGFHYVKKPVSRSWTRGAESKQLFVGPHPTDSFVIPSPDKLQPADQMKKIQTWKERMRRRHSFGNGHLETHIAVQRGPKGSKGARVSANNSSVDKLDWRVGPRWQRTGFFSFCSPCACPWRRCDPKSHMLRTPYACLRTHCTCCHGATLLRTLDGWVPAYEYYYRATLFPHQCTPT